jgi:tetratricopeptide (TPR) repeat protein
MQQGQAMMVEGRLDAAMERYQAALELQPSNPVIHNLLGVARLQGGDAGGAIEAFNRALALAPSYSDARNNRGAAYLRLGQVALAEADFLSVLADRSYANRAGVHFNLGALYTSRGNFAAAEENLRKAAVPAGPLNAYLMLAQVEEQLGKMALAEAAYRDAMARAPERAELPLALGLFLDRQGRRGEAVELYRRVLSLSPDSPEAKQARERLGG